MLDSDYIEQIGSYLVIIGGAEEKKKSPDILRKFVALAQGEAASILILPLASAIPEETAEAYTRIFQHLGAAKVLAFEARARHEVMQADPHKLLDGVTGLFLTGGDQMRLMAILGGTPLSALLKKRVKQGMVLAGTSAGAAGMSATMIIRGKSSARPHQDSIRLAPGLGILQHIIIDQHFSQRKRRSRLITAVCYNPRNLGIGIDENTAILISKDGVLEVVGKGNVTIVDGSHISFSNIADVESNIPFGVFDMRLHILTAGLRYNVFTREPIKVF